MMYIDCNKGKIMEGKQQQLLIWSSIPLGASLDTYKINRLLFLFVLETRFGSACAQQKGGKFSRAFLNSPKFCSLPITLIDQAASFSTPTATTATTESSCFRTFHHLATTTTPWRRRKRRKLAAGGPVRADVSS